MSKKYELPPQTLLDYVRDPLGSLSFYFDIYEGKNFKYAKNMIKVISFVQHLKYQTDEFFGSIFGFLFDIGRIVIPWTGRAIAWVLKSMFTLFVLVIVSSLILELTYAREEIIKSLELRIIEWYLWIYIPLRLFLVIGISYIHMAVWNNRSSEFGNIAISYALISILCTILIGFVRILTAPY